MSLFTVTISGVTNPVEVYGGLAACKDYLGAMIGDGATAFAALTTDSDRGKYLVAATRYIDAQAWAGVADAFGGTTLQFPRSGLLDQYGAAISDAAELVLVNQAAFELVALLAADADVQAAVDSGTNIQSMQAGSARLQFWRPTSAIDGNATMLPVAVNRLIGRWLAASSAALGLATAGVATGVTFDDGDSDDDNPFDGDQTRNIRWPL